MQIRLLEGIHLWASMVFITSFQFHLRSSILTPPPTAHQIALDPCPNSLNPYLILISFEYWSTCSRPPKSKVAPPFLEFESEIMVPHSGDWTGFEGPLIIAFSAFHLDTSRKRWQHAAMFETQRR
jgi:hypothetical protein